MVFFKPKKKQQSRGASSRKPKPSRTFSWGWLFSLTLVLMLSFVLMGVYQGGKKILAQPVSRVVVKGEFLHVDKNRVIAEVEPFLVDGFVMLDLEAVRQQLMQQPWIFDVSLERHWPDELVIAVIEQRPIAQWGEHGFLNHRGELFVPAAKQGAVPGLPVLHGPDDSVEVVMNYFRELSETLASQNLTLASLELDRRGGWSVQLQNNIKIEFGRAEVMEKLSRLLLAFESGLSEDFAKISTIDMRYSNGFAVAWRQQKS